MEKIAVIAVSLVFAICGTALFMDAIDSYREGGSSFYLTAVPGIALLATGLIGLTKARTKVKSKRK